MKSTRWKALLMSICLAGGLLAGAALPATPTEAASSKFTFNGTMSKETLRAYCSRAVTLAGLCVENNAADPIFEEDLRMLLRIGAKYIGRAAYYSWGGNMSWQQIQDHYALAKERADLVHKADPEMILQGGVFEIIYRQTANNTPIPEYVFEAFSLEPETRNFRYLDMVYTDKSHRFYYGNGYWGMGAEAAVPNIASLETQMYFYWQITQYIDAGYEAIHLGQAELMADNKRANFVHWDKVTTMARAYAEVKARRGIILFDCHSGIDSPGMKVGNRLICDIQGAGLVPNETVYEDGAYKCEISHFSKNWLQWIGRSGGGEHPLGFTIEENFTILEFDNYGGNGNPNVATYQGFYNWGYDDVSWFAMQPEWYRNEFILYCDNFLNNDESVLDSDGYQQYFLQPSCRRVLTAYPTLTYTIRDEENTDYIRGYLEKERADYTIGADGVITMTVKKDYRANNPSDACPNGFGQEDTIREIFLGKYYPETPAYTGCVIPGKTTATVATTTTTTTTTTKSVDGTTQPSAGAPTASLGTTGTPTVGDSTPSAPSAGGDTTTVGDNTDTTTIVADAGTTSGEPDGDPTTDPSTEETLPTTTAPDTSTDTAPQPAGMPWGLIAGIAAGVVAVGGIVALLIVKRRKEK